jgi:hypothetical protein
VLPIGKSVSPFGKIITAPNESISLYVIYCFMTRREVHRQSLPIFTDTHTRLQVTTQCLSTAEEGPRSVSHEKWILCFIRKLLSRYRSNEPLYNSAKGNCAHNLLNAAHTLPRLMCISTQVIMSQHGSYMLQSEGRRW